MLMSFEDITSNAKLRHPFFLIKEIRFFNGAKYVIVVQRVPKVNKGTIPKKTNYTEAASSGEKIKISKGFDFQKPQN
jgi:hypothetical protein